MLPSRALRHRYMFIGTKVLQRCCSTCHGRVPVGDRLELCSDVPEVPAIPREHRQFGAGEGLQLAEGRPLAVVGQHILNRGQGPTLQGLSFRILVEIRYESEWGRAMLNVFFILLLASISFGAA